MGKWGNTEFKSLYKLQKNLNEFIEVGRLDVIEDICRELAIRLIVKAQYRTPVDTSALRRAWTTNTEEEAVAGVDVDVVSYVNSLPITEKGNDYIIEVTNPMYYAKYVEKGHRTRDHRNWVEGRHFLRISRNEVQEESPAIVAKKLNEELKRVFLI